MQQQQAHLHCSTTTDRHASRTCIACKITNATAICLQALDVIGKVGFGVDFGATRSISQGDEPGAVFELMEQGEDEICA